MKDKIQKANAVLLGLYVSCGVGLTMATLRKAVADSSGGNNNGCALQIGSNNCEEGYIADTSPVQLSGTACSTVNTYDCCVYNRWRQDCILIKDETQITQKYYNVLIGPNSFKDCQQGSCVDFPAQSSSGGSSSGGSSSGGSSSAGGSSPYYFRLG